MQIDLQRRTLLGTLSTLALAPELAMANTEHDAYPTKPVRMIVGYPAGGPTDTVGRRLALKLGERLRQQVIVENIPGAGANIGAMAAARSAPDGYTVHYNTSTVTIAPWVYPKLGYDLLADFAPVALTAQVPLVLVTHPSLKLASARELIELLRSQAGRFSYGTAGNGTIEHLALAQLMHSFSLQVTHVPYKGVAPALLGLVAGETQFGMTALNTALPYIQDGRMNAMVVCSKSRSAALPSLPTATEALGQKLIYTAWQGILVPKRTPKAIVDRLNRTVNEVLKDEGLRRELAASGVEVIGGSSEEYAAFIKAELTRWADAARVSGAALK